MTQIDDGGPAFPCFHEDTGEIAEGMSLRMWLAGQNHAALLAETPDARLLSAKVALEWADALIEESKR